ncbi:AI-2E family transporter [Limnovirga soli]|jgi:predicted PurR-regulated permease PerM|uniref:AI-2E family transporter n=1 Tax=Limnovirga soli TaxID=2656915 RepID=A0A8J8FFH6_9BACT|nr:AI-2E family transporter [Limnovirga soli]NNV57105.1 AI-2E family transporter [Limnovirga soli]
METAKDYKVNRYFFLAIILIFGLFLLYSLGQFFTAFLSAIILYILSKPVVTWLTKKHNWKKGNAAIIVIVVSFFIILLPITILVSMVVNKIGQAATNPAEIMHTIERFDAVIKEQIGFELITDKNLAAIQSFGTNLLSGIVNQGLGFFSAILMLYFFLYFMITNTNRMEAAILFYLPFKKDKIKMFGDELVAQTFSNAVGIPLIAVAQGLLGFIAYAITGVPEAGFWAVITGFSSILPIVGAGIVWVPIVIIHFASGHIWQGFFLLAWAALLMGSIDNVIRFMLAKRMADVHPIVTVLGVIMGLNYFGFIGLIFGPVVISFFIILLKIYYLEYQKPIVAKKTPKSRQLVPSYMQTFLGNKKE